MADEVTQQAERAVLGACLTDPQIAETIPNLLAAHFEEPKHQAIYSAIRQSLDSEAVPDAVVVSNVLLASGDLERVGGSAYLHRLVNECVTTVNADYYARLVIEAAARRRLTGLAARLGQSAEQTDFANVLASAAETAELVKTLVGNPLAETGPVDGLVEVGALLEQPIEPYDWLVPGLLERMDRVLVVASEGAGKTMLARQVGVMVAQGLHPFDPSQRIEPRRTLTVDLENPPKLVRRKMGNLVDFCRNVGQWKDNAFLWTRPGGLDLKKPEDAAMLERAIVQARPSLVCLGPLYKAGFVASGEAAERTASEVAGVLDRLRERYRIAWWLEHHAPMEQAGARTLRPFGSGLWARWPEFGLAMRKDMDEDPTGHTYALDRFRGDRDERVWPSHLRRGDRYPWEAVYPPGMLDVSA